MKRSGKRMLCLLTAAVLFTACGQAEPEETGPVQVSENKMEEVSEAGTEEEVNLEDFSMPKPEKLDGGDFANVEKAKERLGYEFTAVEKFSNGYEFRWLTVSDDMLVLSYQIGDKKIDLTIMPYEEVKEEEMSETEKIRMQPPIELEGTEVKVSLYFHFECPLNWEELITPQQQEIMDSGRGDGGVDSAPDKIYQHDLYTFTWKQKEQQVKLENEPIYLTEGMEPGREEMEVLAAEWIAANEKTEEAEE